MFTPGGGGYGDCVNGEKPNQTTTTTSHVLNSAGSLNQYKSMQESV